MGDNFDHGSPSHLTYRARDPLGMAMSYPNRGDGVERRYEDSTCYLLVKDDDASLEFVSGGGTYYREGGFRTGDGPMEVVGTNIIANSAWEFFELLEKLSLTNWIDGARNSTRNDPPLASASRSASFRLVNVLPVPHAEIH